MSYSSFTLEELKAKFGVEQELVSKIFSDVKKKSPSSWLTSILERTVPFALMNNSEKARSEYIIAPVFFELHQQSNKQLSVFSGIKFNVDRKKGLVGECDFLVSRSENQSFLEAPVVVAVEAKKQDFQQGFVQCIAEMIAAREFNEQRNQNTEIIFGCVTIGNGWQFLYLKGNNVFIDTTVFDITEDLDKILGILWSMSFGEITF
jgi:hypothetical protein